MSITYCAKCNTQDGLIKRTSFRTGRRLKSGKCPEHTPATATCEMCGRQESSWPTYQGYPNGWDLVGLARRGTPKGYREGYIVELTLLACSECRVQLEEAKAVAVDEALERKGVKLARRLTFEEFEKFFRQAPGQTAYPGHLLPFLPLFKKLWETL